MAGILRIQPDCLIEIGNCKIVLAFCGVDDAAVGIGVDVLRIESDRLTEIGDGAIIVALVPLGDAAL
jgi:hypothetical protein